MLRSTTFEGLYLRNKNEKCRVTCVISSNLPRVIDRSHLWGGGQGKREGGDEGSGGGEEGEGGGRRGGGMREKRGGMKEKRGGRREREEKREGGEERKILRARSARRSRREEGDKRAGGEVRGGRGRGLPPCPPPHLSPSREAASW